MKLNSQMYVLVNLNFKVNVTKILSNYFIITRPLSIDNIFKC